MNREILPVTKNLLIINVIMFLFTYPILADQSAFEALFGMDRLMLASFFPSPDNPNFRPFQVVTNMFMHGSFMHLAFNMYSLWMFGSIVEGALGHKRYLLFYLLCGFGALLLHWAATYFFASGELVNIGSGMMIPDYYRVPVLGASGAIYGVLVGFAYIAPNAVLQLIFPPVALKAKYLVLIFIGIDLYSGFSNFNSGIAHFAHLGGAMIGFLLLSLWARSGGLYGD